jgi:phage recombination protein Bet
MTTALAERPVIGVSADEMDLIKRTVANGASDAELKLFLFDCQRRGVHPLDKLLHFTKRGGKYTPVTSIDFMRSQAAMTGEMAGSDDPVFVETSEIVSATVSVYRLTQGQRFAYTATARWAEYCPDNAQMWRRMPHTMLGKCAEALALRKAFPQQLAGLYAREEMEQAGEPHGYTVTHPDAPATNGGEPPPSVQSREQPDDGALRVVRVESRPTKNKSVTKYLVVLSDGREVSTIKQPLASLAEQLCQGGDAVVVATEDTRFGENLVDLRRDDGSKSVAPVDSGVQVDLSEIPF